MDARAYVVMDNNDEIYAEYLRNLNLGGQKEVGNIFLNGYMIRVIRFLNLRELQLKKHLKTAIKNFQLE